LGEENGNSQHQGVPGIKRGGVSVGFSEGLAREIGRRGKEPRPKKRAKGAQKFEDWAWG